MRVVFRTDSSSAIGTGHLMRCLTLARSLRQRGADVSFVYRNLPGNLCRRVEREGFPVHRLPYDDTMVQSDYADLYARWLVVDAERDASESLSVLSEGPALDWLIVDHYGLDASWHRRLREVTDRIMVIDDLANRSYDCDLLLDQNLYDQIEERYVGRVPSDCTTLLGADYALLRDEFRNHRRPSLDRRDGRVQRLFIFMGGADPHNITDTVISAIQQVRGHSLSGDVVVGLPNTNYESIVTRYGTESNITIHRGPENIAEIMTGCDLAIGAGGATTWERCCLGLPTLLIATAQHEAAISQVFRSEAIGRYCGLYSELTPDEITTHILDVADNAELIRSWSCNAARLVDGEGAGRVLSSMSAVQSAGVAR